MASIHYYFASSRILPGGLTIEGGMMWLIMIIDVKQGYYRVAYSSEERSADGEQAGEIQAVDHHG